MGRVLRILSLWYRWLHAGLGAIAAVLIAFVAIGISVDVVIRNSGIGVVSWMLEAAEYALFVATFLGAPWVLRAGGHVRVDVVVTSLPRRARWVFEVLADTIGLLVSCVLLYYAVRISHRDWLSGSRIIKEFIFPEWWLYALVSVSFVLLIVEFALRLARAARGATSAAPSRMATPEL